MKNNHKNTAGNPNTNTIKPYKNMITISSTINEKPNQKTAAKSSTKKSYKSYKQVTTGVTTGVATVMEVRVANINSQ